MTDTSREGLIEKMAQALYEREYDKDHYPWDNEEYKAPYLEDARAALAVAEPVIREQCAKIAEKTPYAFDAGKDMNTIAAVIREDGT